MADKYEALRAALDSQPVGDNWVCINYSPKTLGVGISGGPALFMAREGSYTDIAVVKDIVRNLLTVRREARALLAERDALRESLRWTAAVLQDAAGSPYCVDENGVFVIEGESRTMTQILDAADAALAQHQGEKHV